MIYLDNSATTKPSAACVSAMTRLLCDHWGNPSSVHDLGIEAERELKSARKAVVNALGAEPDRVFFTSGGTEADNWAIFSACERLGKRGRHIITTAVEHHAVLHPFKVLEARGFEVTYLQPDEEGFMGAKAMLKAGVLEAPKPQAAMALHVNSGTPSGLVLCGKGTFMAGCTLFRITVKGVGCHGAMPETGVDPINIAAHIYLALQEITARELPAKTPAIVTMGKFSAGHAPNIIPQEAVIEGTIRTFDRDVTALILRRIGEIADATARAFRGSASVEELASAPPLKNDEALTEQMARCAEMLFGEKSVYRLHEGGMGSEDFASYTYELPCAYLLLGAGTAQEDVRYGKPMHNESVVFNENILPRGSALLAYGAMQWLEDQE